MLLPVNQCRAYHAGTSRAASMWDGLDWCIVPAFDANSSPLHTTIYGWPMVANGGLTVSANDYDGVHYKTDGSSQHLGIINGLRTTAGIGTVGHTFACTLRALSAPSQRDCFYSQAAAYDQYFFIMAEDTAGRMRIEQNGVGVAFTVRPFNQSYHRMVVHRTALETVDVYLDSASANTACTITGGSDVTTDRVAIGIKAGSGITPNHWMDVSFGPCAGWTRELSVGEIQSWMDDPIGMFRTKQTAVAVRALASTPIAAIAANHYRRMRA